ncbi:nucleolar GTP-binding protein 1-like [Trifolium medium]|uniref:Nucleolar GTP-binding protein 1-like n=1 Tax=Trifolium medium TaxID=97028 RepID=A0A392QFF1_9FABA|nr:nucleolar GTP-binding protein 1-like [Trifolium medium]
MQFSIYKEIREKFSGHLWLDVVSKADLLKSSPVIYATEDRDLTQHELEKYLKSGPDGAINVSVTTQKGIHEITQLVFIMVLQ